MLLQESASPKASCKRNQLLQSFELRVPDCQFSATSISKILSKTILKGEAGCWEAAVVFGHHQTRINQLIHLRQWLKASRMYSWLPRSCRMPWHCHWLVSLPANQPRVLAKMEISGQVILLTSRNQFLEQRHQTDYLHDLLPFHFFK